MNGLARDFFRVGLSGRVAPFDAPMLAERVARRFSVAPDGLEHAYDLGQRQRAREAVRRHLAGMADTVLQSDGAGGWIEVQADNDNVDPRALIETAARAADIPAEDIVSIVADAAPGACAEESPAQLASWARMALEDFQRIPARRGAPAIADEIARVPAAAANAVVPIRTEAPTAGIATPNQSEAHFDLESEPGLLGDIARWSQTCAFRPVREFAQPAALATLSVLFGRRWATPTGLGLNLYLVAVAETGGGKDALIGAPRTLLASAGFRQLLGPGDFSSDAAIEKSLRVRPVQLMPLDEFGKLAQAMQGRNAPSFAKLAAKALLEIYPRSAPGSEWTGKARASDEHDCAADPVYSPTLSLLGVSTPEGFFDGMSQENLNDGFLNRLTVVRAGKAGARQRDPSRLIPPAPLVDALRSAYEQSLPAGNLASAAVRDAGAAPAMSFARWADASAIEAIERVEAWEDEAGDAGRRGVTGRTAEQVQKIATLRALSRCPADPAVEVADIEWAFEMVKASIAEIERGARENMSGSEFEALVNAVERAVVAAGDGGIAWSHLVRAKGVSRADGRLLEAAVKRLEEGERVWRIGPKRLKVRRPDERRDD